MRTAAKGKVQAPPPMTGNKPNGVRGHAKTGYSAASASGNGKRSNNMVAGNASRKR